MLIEKAVPAVHFPSNFLQNLLIQDKSLEVSQLPFPFSLLLKIYRKYSKCWHNSRWKVNPLQATEICGQMGQHGLFGKKSFERKPTGLKQRDFFFFSSFQIFSLFYSFCHIQIFSPVPWSDVGFPAPVKLPPTPEGLNQ